MEMVAVVQVTEEEMMTYMTMMVLVVMNHPWMREMTYQHSLILITVRQLHYGDLFIVNL